MKNKVSVVILFSLLLLMSILPLAPARISASDETIVVDYFANVTDGGPVFNDYIFLGLLNGNFSRSAIKFTVPNDVSEAILKFNSWDFYIDNDLSTMIVQLGTDNWTTGQFPNVVTPEKKVTITKAALAATEQQINEYDSVYSIDVTSLLTPSNIGADRVVTFILSGTYPSSFANIEIFNPRLDVTYGSPNVAPVVSAIGTQSVNEGSLLSVQVVANDANGDTLTYSLVDPPQGAAINSSGLFTWTPSETQDGSHTITVRVTDGKSDPVERQFTVTVSEVNVKPVLGALANREIDEETLLSFTATASDSDRVGAGQVPNTLTFSLAGTVPTGASITSAGAFTWTPTEAQGPGSYTITIRVSDGALYDEKSFTVTVNEVNKPPVITPIIDQTVDELDTLSVNVLATDSEAMPLSYSLVDPPDGANISNSGEFTWTPDEDQDGTYTITVRVSDGTNNTEEQFQVTVDEVNEAPVLDPIGDRSIDEETELTIIAKGTDDDVVNNVPNTLTYSLEGSKPAGAQIDEDSGVFTWTPTEAQGPGSYSITIRVSDEDGAYDEETIDITVNETNAPPALNLIGDQTIDELDTLTFTVTASDQDPAPELTYSLDGAPTGATIDPETGVFTWTPTEAQGPNSYTFNIVVTDEEDASDEQEITVTVNEVNVAPVLEELDDELVVNEGSLLTFTAEASDVDLPENELTFSLDGAPTGATIDPETGVFRWTPSEDQGPASYTFNVVVTDDKNATDEQEITVTVNEVNVAPVLEELDDELVVNEGSLLTFTAEATDVDLPENELTFSLDGAPTGATIDPETGVFRWTPSEAQGPASYTFNVVVTDDKNATDEQEITVTVNEVNVAPVLEELDDELVVNEGSLLTFTAEATDVDLPENELTFSLDGAPTGATIDPETGVFTWTPSESQGPNSYTFNVVVTDEDDATDEQEITVTVNEVNVAPVLDQIDDELEVNEGSLLTFIATATDVDLPENKLTFSLDGAPAGASIHPETGVFTWTPSENQGPGTYTFEFVVTDEDGAADEQELTVTVNEVNVAPVLAELDDELEVNEGSLLTFTATATDVDLPENELTFSLDGAPTGASIHPETGVFTWTPSENQGPDSYTFNVVVTDEDGATDEQEITVTVNEVNVAPVLAELEDELEVNEGNLLTFTASATDVDLPENELTFSLDGAPTGASIDPETGVFRWTPSEDQGPDSYSFNVVVTDEDGASDEQEITVTVNEVNVAPVLAELDDEQEVNEGSLLTFTVTATDVDLPENELIFSLDGAPTGASIDEETGVFTWTPSESQGPNSYTFNVVVTDEDGATDEQEITVTVNEVNVAPVLEELDDELVVNEGSLLTFTAEASDVDLPENELTFSLDGAPTGATIDPETGVFRWTPSEAQGPNSYTFNVVVTDDKNETDEQEITVTVNEVNVAPVLDQIDDELEVNEGSLLTFIATATDVDLPENELTFSLDGAPAGASIHPETGVFTWTPSENQGPGTYTFEFVVTDEDGAADEQELTVTVNEVNVAPVLAELDEELEVNEGSLLTFIASATDVDLPENELTFSLDGAPTGASIHPETGVFTWTPSENQGPDSYTFNVVVTDEDGATDEQEITVTVNEVNVAPVLAELEDEQEVNEGSLLTFTASATDVDLPENELTFSLDGAPTGASIDPETGVFTWTPSEDQGPDSYTFNVVVTDEDGASDEQEITVTVNEVNVAPVLAELDDEQEVNEGSLLTFTVTATDVDLPENELIFSLDGAPTGASIDEETGVFTWTPTEAQGAGDYTFNVVVSDGTTSVQQAVKVTVNEVNEAPLLAAIADQEIDEEGLFTFIATASDVDLPANTLTFNLVDAPEGAQLNEETGEFTWTPTEEQGPGSYTFKVVVSDGALSDEQEVTLTVREVNVAPELGVIANRTLSQGSMLKFTATATDADVPSNTLTYSLIDAPEGAAIDSETGEFTWRPAANQASKTFTFKVQVSDGELTDEQEVTVRVYAAYTPIEEQILVEVLVNGKFQSIGTASVSEVNGQRVVTITVDEQKLDQQLAAEGDNPVVTIVVNTNDSDVVVGQLSGSIIEKLDNRNAVIVIQANGASYTLPSKQLNLTAVTSKLGSNINLKDVSFKIEIAKPGKEVREAVEQAVTDKGLTLAMEPLSFTVTATYGGKTVDITSFNVYIERKVTLPAGVDPSRITTAVVVEEDGTIRHVPTRIISQNNVHYAVISSLTNSTYALVWNPVKFIDVENHWAKNAVNNMGSRLIVNGSGNGLYQPDQDITRAEFAAIVVRGLGLRVVTSERSFSDVSAKDWYYAFIQTAYEYGLINGFEDGTIRPNDHITREQAMLIISKAMKITQLQGAGNAQVSDIVNGFADAGIVSSWAIDGVADSVSAGIITGRNNLWLAPKENITRAEVAMILQRLLQKSELID